VNFSSDGTITDRVKKGKEVLITMVVSVNYLALKKKLIEEEKLLNKEP
jgi:hypothetical protein